jgi:hypothetical protein
MGKIDTSTQGDKRRARLMSWYGNVQQIQTLAKVCVAGTTKNEYQLLGDMRTRDNDDIWALCRLVMFGNIQTFADAHQDKQTCQMRLTREPLEFVMATAETLGDWGIWERFTILVPDAQASDEPPSTPPPRALVYQTTPPPEPARAPYFPQLPTPPPSPPHASPGAPASPPCVPASPQYTPQSPQYTPQSPQYTPQSPPCVPASPPYVPVPPDSSDEKVANASKLLDMLRQYSLGTPTPPPDMYDPMNPGM